MEEHPTTSHRSCTPTPTKARRSRGQIESAGKEMHAMDESISGSPSDDPLAGLLGSSRQERMAAGDPGGDEQFGKATGSATRDPRRSRRSQRQDTPSARRFAHGSYAVPDPRLDEAAHSVRLVRGSTTGQTDASRAPCPSGASHPAHVPVDSVEDGTRIARSEGCATGVEGRGPAQGPRAGRGAVHVLQVRT